MPSASRIPRRAAVVDDLRLTAQSYEFDPIWPSGPHEKDNPWLTREFLKPERPWQSLETEIYM